MISGLEEKDVFEIDIPSASDYSAHPFISSLPISLPFLARFLSLGAVPPVSQGGPLITWPMCISVTKFRGRYHDSSSGLPVSDSHLIKLSVLLT